MNLVYNDSLFYLRYSCANPIFGGKSDCRIFKSTIALEQCDKKVYFFACWYKLIKIKIWLKDIEEDVVKNGCGDCGFTGP